MPLISLCIRTNIEGTFREKIKSYFLLVLILLGFHSIIKAQSSRSLATGNASSTFTDEWSLLHNPAGLSWENGAFVNFSYMNHQFIPELAVQTLGIGHRKNNKGYGISINRQGDHRLKESNYSAVYSQLFANIFSLGISLNYRELAFNDIYGKRRIFYGSFGFLTKIQDDNYLSFHIINPSRQIIDKKSNERLETIVSSGYTHYFSSIFSVKTEIEKGLNSKYNFKVGFQYDIRSRISILMGYEMGFRRFSSGLVIEFKKFVTDLSFSYENTLGFRTGIGISYSIAENK